MILKKSKKSLNASVRVEEFNHIFPSDIAEHRSALRIGRCSAMVLKKQKNDALKFN